MRKTLFLLSLIFLNACGFRALEAGEKVIVDWHEDSWHPAVLVAECEAEEEEGWTVDFEDDFYNTEEGLEPDCYPLYAITRDAVPDEKKVRVDKTVLGEWAENSYSSALVKTVEGGVYTVVFSSDQYETELSVDQIRVLPEEKAPATQ